MTIPMLSLDGVTAIRLAWLSAERYPWDIFLRVWHWNPKTTLSEFLVTAHRVNVFETFVKCGICKPFLFVENLNNRPRKTRGYLIPNQMFNNQFKALL